MKVGVEYLAAGGNRHPSAADWDDLTGLLAYGSGRNLVLWTPLDTYRPGISAIHSGHSDTINAVKFLPRTADDPIVVITGSADKTLRLWQGLPDYSTGLRYVASLEGHSGSLNSIATVLRGDIIVSGAADGTLKVWQFSWTQGEATGQLLQTIKLTPKFFPLAIAMHQLGDSGAIVLAVGGTKTSIQIFVGTEDTAGFDFVHKATLLGHEGWIRSLEFVQDEKSEDSDLLLASASQDKYIRLWRIRRGSAAAPSSDVSQGTPFGIVERTLSNKAHHLDAAGIKHSLAFEALLLGHEDWIYTTRWHQTEKGLLLLSASADNSLAIWEADTGSGVWVCTTRLGEISAQKGSTTATGSSGGFWIGLWSPDGQSVVSLGRTGSWRHWHRDNEENRWDQRIGISGHVDEVRALSWSRAGKYLLSTSADQTTRLHARWKRGSQTSWHEIARPQIHGYDLNCVDSLGESQFISGADEKLLRVFDEPRNVAEILANISEIRRDSDSKLPEAANMPVLGLSNKAMDLADVTEVEAVNSLNDLASLEHMQPFTAPENSVFDINEPPSEDLLARHTLWPEREKLYGHGYEISALTSSHDGTLVATACKASSLEHAVIRLYETKDWREIRPSLKAHSLTVTCLRFSDNDEHLLSVGRDRQWAVFAREKADDNSYKLLTFNPKGHSRMILGAAWAPSKARRLFSTAGRDKTIKLWVEDGQSFSCQISIPAPAAVTTIAFEQSIHHSGLLLAAGLETGDLFIYMLDPAKLEIMASLKLDIRICPSLAVTQVVWQPSDREDLKPQENQISAVDQTLLAISSEDHSVRILSVETEN